LVELLSQWYPLDHQVILYEAVTLPIQQPRIEPIALSDLPKAQMDLKTTLVIPPATVAKANRVILDQLNILAAQEN
jgi:hypothetical protein